MRKNLQVSVLTVAASVSLFVANLLQADTISWNVGSGDWDILTSTNWTADAGGRNDNRFNNGDNVSFSNASGGAINIVTDVAPASTTVNATSGTYTFSGSNFSGALVKANGGTLVLNSQQTSGTYDVTGGTLQWGAAERLPDNAVNLSYSGGTWDMQNHFETLGGLRGSHNIINFGGMLLTVGGDANGGDISGAGSLTFDLTDASTIHYYGKTGSYTGGTTINDGSVRMYIGSNRLPTTGVLNVNGPGSFYLSHAGGGLTQTIGALNGDGSVFASLTNASSSSFIVGNGGGSGTFDGVYSGLGSLTKQGAGTQVMNGNNSYTGTTTVSGGTLLVNGITGPSQLSYTVQAGATLGGNGTIGLAGGEAVIMQNGSFLEPGSNGAGTLTINGGLTLNDGATITMQLAGSNSDKIDINGMLTGSTSAGGITLDVSGVAKGSYVLLDWTDGTVSGFELSDINLVGGEFEYLTILDSQLLYIVPIPEPNSISLLALGLLAFVRSTRRRKLS